MTTGEEPEKEAEGENELVEVQQRSVPAKSGAKNPAERTDDPVRMYFREMSSVELLSREGEIAIAKRIEAGREAMIAGLCESPLTFQAIIIWRDELNEGKVFLRDIIDLDATYAGPGVKVMPAPVISPDGRLIAGVATPGKPERPPQMQALAIAPATPFKPTDERADGEETATDGTIGESNLDDDDMQNWVSVAAIEAELKPKVIESFDTIADTYKRLRRLQDQDIQFQLKRLSLSPAQERKYKKLKSEIIGEVELLRLNQARIDTLVEQLYEINKRLIGYEGRLMRLAESHGVVRDDFLKHYLGSTRSGSTACRSSRKRAGRASLPKTRTKSGCIARISMRSPWRRASTSASSAKSSMWCNRASDKRAKLRRKWWRRTCASSSRSRRNPLTVACSSWTSSRKATSA